MDNKPDNLLAGSTRIYLQEACLRHQFIRSKDTSNIVERPERLRAINIGISAAVSRLEYARKSSSGHVKNESYPSHDELAESLGRIDISGSSAKSATPQNVPVELIKSSASVDLLHNPAVKFIHGDIEGDVYLENLIKWAAESKDKIATTGTEIPEGFPQGDLYLCPTSVEAIQGALGTVCEAVDDVILAPLSQPPTGHRAFVAVRPPGHHCGENTPIGFCFVNNVAVAAAHAHLKHGIARVVIFDIDLHHGNGTQSLAWQINEESYRQRLEDSFRDPTNSAQTTPGLQIFYGSLHDILSYPCEEGKLDLVQAASVSIHGPHGQYVENIHLQPYNSEEEFWSELYEKKYKSVFQKAEEFVRETAQQDNHSVGDDVIVFISCGFDASEHEYPSMSRHGRKVPTSFYHRFARDTVTFAEVFAKGRLVSVLEGGYSDRALTSGVMAHICGLAGGESSKAINEDVMQEWWNVENLTKLEKATKKRRGGRASLQAAPTAQEPWIERTLEIFSSIDSTPPPAHAVPVAPALLMSLRDRTKKPADNPVATDKNKPGKKAAAQAAKEVTVLKQLSDISSGSESDAGGQQSVPNLPAPTGKKLPRVVLKLGPKP